MQTRLFNELRNKPNLSRGYSIGPYNKIFDDYQHIRITEGCPNNCWFCGETRINGSKPIYYDIPEIKRNKVRILDMNLIYKPNAVNIIKELGSKKVNNKVVYYEFWCGIDYRYLTQEKADVMKKNRFINPRIAWDHEKTEQLKIKKAIEFLENAGYKRKNIMVFILGNGIINFKECMIKLLQCLYWGVQVDPCYFDNQCGKNIKPMYWDSFQLKLFAFITRKMNQIIRHDGFDPE